MPALRTWTVDDQATLRTWVQARLSSTPNAAAQSLWDLLHAPTSVSRGPAPAVPAPFTWQDMRGALSLASRGNLVAMGPSFTRILDLIDDMERTKLVGWIVDLLSFAKITSAESTALNTILNATIADPNWQATALTGSSPRQTLFPSVDQWWTTTDPTTAAGSSMITLTNLQGAMV